jgi:hypothetical protein
MEAPPPIQGPPALQPRKTNPALWWTLGIVGCGGAFFCLIIMAAILFPVFQEAKVAASDTRCISNLKQIGLAGVLYASDYDDTLPEADSWVDVFEPYLREFDGFQCPAELLPYGYAFNKEVSRVTVTELEAPDMVPLVFDSTIGSRNAVSGLETLPDPPRHRRDRNFAAYVDGSAAVIPRPPAQEE